MRATWPILILLAASSFRLEANPTGGDVTAGSATIAGQGSSAVTISQASHTAIINWNTFSIGSGELTKFVQPSSTSATLNRVLGGQTSFINGTLSANGQVYLINGNGIVVGPGGVITAAGFTGSTRDIADSDFLSGNLHFTGSGGAGVTNLGTITALGGNVVLIGKTVDNEGTIDADGGTAGLVAGDDVLLAQENADGSTITVNPVSDPSTPSARQKVGVKNTGTITASTAELKAANGNIYALAIDNEGLVRASTVTQQGGHIYLTSDSGTIVNSGTLDASATAAKGQGGKVLVKSTAGKVVHSGKLLAKGGAGGVGGSADISGAQLEFTGTVDFTAPGGTTGDLLLDPATLDVITGGGGSVTTPTGMPPSSQNDSTGSTIDPSVVDAALSSANLTLNADTNITVSNAISWDSANTLTFSTNTTGSTVKINAAITDSYSGAGGLLFDLAAATDAISTSINGTINVANFILQRGAWTQLVNVGGNGGNIPQTLVNGTLTNVLPAFTATNDFEIDAGTFLRADSGNGSTVAYGLEDVYGLQGVNGFLNSNFTLNNRNIDASGTSTWNSGDGFVPIGSLGTPYNGNFEDGAINGLTINLPDSQYVGLFAALGANAYIYDVSLDSFNVTGNEGVGALAGDNQGYLEFDFVEDGSITGTQGVVGGLVGANESNGTLDDCYNYYANVTGSYQAGGAAGYNDGTINTFQGYAYVDGGEEVGGIAGENDVSGTISASTNSGSVTGDDELTDGSSYAIGGIAGENDGTITGSNTYPGATVSGDGDVGGLVGYNDGFIVDSYNSATVTGTGNEEEEGESSNIGGIAGENQSTNEGEGTSIVSAFISDDDDGPVSNPNSGIIQTSYNTGAVDGSVAVGGIVGLNDYSGTVTTCYNVGAIGDSDASNVGGIVGDNYGYVTNTYNSGLVQGADGSAGGIIGYDEYSGDTEYSYWDTVTSGQSVATNTDEEEGAYEVNLASVSSTSGTAYTIAGNNTSTGVGFGYFGTATAVPGTNGVYEIGTSPDMGGGPAWYIIDGETRPLLGMEANGTITSPHQLQLIAVNLTGSYTIESYLDMSVTTNAAEIWTTAGFVPIGAAPGEGSYAFNGYVYGDGETIQDLTINLPGDDDVGLFGYAGAGATLEEITLDDSSITGNNNVGGLVGVNYGDVDGVGNNNDGTGGIVGNGNNVGGIAGDNFGQITYSENSPDENASVTAFGNNIGGIAGFNEAGATLAEDSNSGTVQAAGGSDGSDGVGGIAGSNAGTVTQSINTGNVGSGVEANVGGLVGDNLNTVSNSVSGISSSTGNVNGASDVGGLVGYNESGATLESSYDLTPVSGGDTTTTGSLVGLDDGVVQHVYFDTDTTNGVVGIGMLGEDGQAMDVAGYTTAQLADITNYAQGASPEEWDFSPQTGDGGGIWGINVYNNNGQVNNGLPVLQWQYPVNVEVAVNGGSQPYGYTPSYTATGEGVSQIATELPSGPTYTVTGNGDAGDTQQVTLTGNPVDYNYNIEYVNGAVNVVPDPLDIVANSFVVASGSPTPTFTVTYTGFQPGHDASDLDGTIQYVVTPLPDTAIGQHTITASGQTSPIGDQDIANYAITYFTGILEVTTTSPTPSQEAATFTAEIASLQNQFGNDPYNGLDPLYYLTIPNQVVLGGDLFGAINNEPDATDYAYASSTSTLPALSRLATPDTGVVEIIDGRVVIGDPKTGKPVFLNQPGAPLSQTVLSGLQGVLSPSVYNALLALIHGQ